jgi:retron-type reverse transcriptase
LLERFASAPADSDQLAEAILRDEDLLEALPPHLPAPRIRHWFFPAPSMAPKHAKLAGLSIAQIETEGALMELLALSAGELEWYADLTRRNLERGLPEAFRHYRYRWVKKASGGARLLETPKHRLKNTQRWILKQVLEPIPCDGAAHGFVRGRSAHTFVQAHVGQRVVLRMDLEDFFISIGIARVRAVFSSVGYPARVARLLAGLCCAPTPGFVRRAPAGHMSDPHERFLLAQRLATAHLPQGAPTSPALSNLVAYRLDRRLHGLARSAGCHYTRYADDLAFSGGTSFEKGLSSFVAHAAAIVEDEGFRVRYRKTRVMRSGAQQRLAGLVVNRRVSVPRRDRDRLRAILHNCVRHGPASQNQHGHEDFRAHLEGRIAWLAASHPAQAARLRELFARVAW